MAKSEKPESSQPAAPEGDEPDRLTEPSDSDQKPRLPFPIVAMGGSAGGLEAFQDFFRAMPPDRGIAFVLIQHLSPQRESLMADILARHTKMPVLQVEQGMRVEKDHVYVIRPGHTLTIKDGVLHLGEQVEKPGHSRPVDDFFKSLAQEQQERAIAIVMSGMGSNGTQGAQFIKAVGGLCIAQDPETAKFSSMPRHLIDSGMADFVLSPADMPERLLRYAQHPYARESQSIGEELLRREAQQFNEILKTLRTRLRHDFSGYKKPTVVRRIQRRMGLNQVHNLGEYVELLRNNAPEITALGDDLMIHVTGFFRDPGSWDSLQRLAIEPLIAERSSGSDIRCWVSACSTGEEAYTIGMLLLEAAEKAHKHFDIKIFATDTAERTLSHARGGIYPGGIESEVSPERMVRFFDKEDAVYRIKKELRELVVFAPQNVLTDPPFSRLDIITCRNLLIYLEPEIQRRVLSLLHFGLREGGALLLGTSETVSSADDLFEPIDKKWRIYRRIGPTRHGLVEFPLPRTSDGAGRDSLDAPPRVSINHLANKVLLEQYTPPAVVVDAQNRIVFFHGNTEKYLQNPRGEPTRDVFSMVMESMRGAVRAALQKSITENVPAEALDGVIEAQGKVRRRLVVRTAPLGPLADGYYIVSFEERDDPTPMMQAPGQRVAINENKKKDDELSRVRGELQATIEELQSSNEELKASNEEVTSINEELQSANEELETSKEELQSLNEELTTVNSQLTAKMDELEHMTNDLKSLLASSDIAVIFLDTHFRIRRYTPAVRDLLELIPGDVGRPLSDMARKFTDEHLPEDAQAVLERLVPLTREISSHTGRRYSRRILPYRTTDNRIDGVVVTFIDITERAVAEENLRQALEQLEASAKMKDQFLATLSHELRTPLSAILLWTRILQDKSAEPEQFKEGLEVIERSAESQRTLVDDLLDTSRIASGKLRLEIRDVDMFQLVESAITTIAPAAQVKRLTIEQRLSADVGHVRADADRLRQVVWNLLSNAVKFTPANGTVTIGLRRDGETVEIKVADTGRGISPEFLPHIFSAFRQMDGSMSRRHSGLGLGLAISKALIELHGGSIAVYSDGLDKGAAFVIRLPLPPSQPSPGQGENAQRESTPPGKAEGAHVLLVEDDAPTRKALQMFLGHAGLKVTAVASAAEALAAYQKSRPDVIVSDLGMPGMDGFALLQKIRKQEEMQTDLPVPAIALSAFAQEQDRMEALHSGFQYHLAKPVAPAKLLADLQALAAQARSARFASWGQP